MTALLLVALTLQPQVLGGTRVERAAGAGLAPVVAEIAAGAADVAWIGYDVPSRGGEHGCWDARRRGSDAVTRLEPPDRVHVLLRVEGRAVSRVRLSSPDCAVDTGGRTLHWLTGVRPADSVALLEAYVTGTGSTRALANGAMAALAQHAEPAALARLLALARDAPAPHTRGQALFWLAQRAGDQAVGVIARAVTDDPDTAVKRQAVFALSQLPAADGVPRLIDVARTHSNPAVRKQAFFWLGQSKDPRALAFFEDVLRR